MSDKSIVNIAESSTVSREKVDILGEITTKQMKTRLAVMDDHYKDTMFHGDWPVLGKQRHDAEVAALRDRLTEYDALKDKYLIATDNLANAKDDVCELTQERDALKVELVTYKLREKRLSDEAWAEGKERQ